MKTTCPLRWLLLPALFLCADCSFFSRQPPLPRRAAVEPNGGDETFSDIVQSADIIYFPVESVALQPRSSAAWKLLEALNRNGGPFALAVDTAAGDERARRALSAEAGRSGAHVLPLHVPPEPAAVETSLESVPPPEDFESFAQRFSSRALKEPAIRAEYELSLIRQQLVAEKIVSYFREHRSEKILVFLRRDEVRGDYAVPYFVGKKTKARQLILNPQRRRESAPGLLTRN